MLLIRKRGFLGFFFLVLGFFSFISTNFVSLEEATRDPEAIQRLAQELYQSLESNSSGIRLLGVTLTNFSSESRETHEGSLIEETP